MTTYLRITSDMRAETPVPYQDYGIVGDGKTFDHAGVRSLIGALEDSGIVHLAGAPTILLGETVEISQRKGLILTTDRRPFPDGLNVPRFTWGGAKGGTMFSLDRCQELMLDGFAFETDDPHGVRAPANIAIDVDGGPDTKGSGFGSSCTFRRLRHLTTKPNPDCIFIAIARTTQWNQEYHDIVDCAGNGNGAGSFLFQGPSANAKQTRVRRCRGIMGYEKAIWMQNGSLHLDLNNLSGNTWNLYLEGSSEVCTEHATTTEQSQHHAYYGCAMESWGGKFDPSHTPTGDAYIVFGRQCRHVAFRGGLDVGLPLGARALGFENDASNRLVDVSLDIDNGWTRAQLGIDADRLAGAGDPSQQVGAFHFRTRAGCVTDLPSGELRFNLPAPTVEYLPNLFARTPTVDSILEGPVPWETLSPGTSVDYHDPSTGYWRRQSVYLDGTRHEGPVGAYKKVKP